LHRRSHELHFDFVAAAKSGFISAAVPNSRSPSQCPISLQGEVTSEETDSGGAAGAAIGPCSMAAAESAVHASPCT
jgi:hypothetical protein